MATKACRIRSWTTAKDGSLHMSRVHLTAVQCRALQPGLPLVVQRPRDLKIWGYPAPYWMEIKHLWTEVGWEVGEEEDDSECPVTFDSYYLRMPKTGEPRVERYEMDEDSDLGSGPGKT